MDDKIAMIFSVKANRIFKEVVAFYHRVNGVEQIYSNPYLKSTQPLESLLYRKCWIDTVQWHYEDRIRDPYIDPVLALTIKRKIDTYNQYRCDIVERLDCYFLDIYKEAVVLDGATLNTESPAWAVDRLSILALKIYHMHEEVFRENTSKAHRERCQHKLDILSAQKADLSTAIDQLLDDIAKGKKRMEVYRQMKMYNDDRLNPVLRGEV